MAMPNKSAKTMQLFLLLLIVLALPVTVFIAQQPQNLKQQAMTAQDGKLIVQTTSLAPGAPLVVTWLDIAEPINTDKIVLRAVGSVQTSVVDFKYIGCEKEPTSANPSGHCIFTMPKEPGVYTFSYLHQDNAILTSQPVSVK